MSMDKNSFKVIFGAMIFLFSLALAYFSASYLSKEMSFDYWVALLLFAAVYIAVGAAVFQIFAVSLGFLFSADVLILHLMLEKFGDTFTNLAKAAIIGCILAILYIIALNYKENESTLPPPTPTLQ